MVFEAGAAAEAELRGLRRRDDEARAVQLHAR